MPNKKKNMGAAGGILLLIGSLIYLYVVFSWYSGGAMTSAWLNAAAFLGPFVAAFAILGAISLFFMSVGVLAGKVMNDKMAHVLWKFVLLGALSLFIVTALGPWFYWVVLGFIFTYVGAVLTKE
jgi:uncharacterized membrane protein